jgi:hypothetical protein
MKSQNDDEEDKLYNISLVLRENGRVETYSDFMLTDETTEEESQIIDIETDFEYFYIKSLKDAVLEEDDAAIVEKKAE